MKVCPDCAAEGNADPQPLEHFYVLKSPKYKNGQRVSAYCRRHTKARNAEAAKNAPAGSGIRESRKRARKAWRERNPDKWKAIMRGVTGRRKLKNAKTYTAWVAAHPEQRQASQQAWYRQRTTQRTPKE